jgi:DNA helicase HerA-like ATPase
VILALDGLELEAQMRCAAVFMNTCSMPRATSGIPRWWWWTKRRCLPAAAGDVADEVRRLSLAAMTNLMCRGRKRGLAGIIATQRLKLAKNVAAEASNFLMGRTFLDIDMARAADLLGMERRQAEPSAIWSAAISWRLARRSAAARGGAIADVETRAQRGAWPDADAQCGGRGMESAADGRTADVRSARAEPEHAPDAAN